MKLYELAALGKQLRDAQNTYFSERTQTALAAAKRLEHQFDAVVLQIIGDHESLIACQQMGLFGENDDVSA